MPRVEASLSTRTRVQYAASLLVENLNVMQRRVSRIKRNVALRRGKYRIDTAVRVANFVLKRSLHLYPRLTPNEPREIP